MGDAIRARLTQALRVATHSPHDQAGEPVEGFPVCSLCGAIQTRAARAEPGLASVEIRATHRYGFRSGEWATVTGLAWMNDRACYQVRFPDGVTDSWVVHDPTDPYEFRAAASPDPAQPDRAAGEGGL